MPRSRMLHVAEVLGFVIGVATLVYLFIQIDYYRERLTAVDLAQMEAAATTTGVGQHSAHRLEGCPGTESGQWHITLFIVRSDYNPYKDLKLQYLYGLQIAEDCSITGVGEKTHEADRELERDRRSQLTIVSGRLTVDSAVLNIHETDFRGRKSHVVMTLRLITANELVGYSTSSVANTFALVHGIKQ